MRLWLVLGSGGEHVKRQPVGPRHGYRVQTDGDMFVGCHAVVGIARILFCAAGVVLMANGW